MQPLISAAALQAAACDVGFPGGNRSSRSAGEGVTALQGPGRPSFKETSSCTPFFHLSHVTWHVFSHHVRTQNSVQLELRSVRKKVLFCFILFTNISYKWFPNALFLWAMVLQWCILEGATGGTKPDSWHLGRRGWVTHHHTREKFWRNNLLKALS